jgi:hypothetical protein
MKGTRMMRPSVMMFGILNSVASRLPALFFTKIRLFAG